MAGCCCNNCNYTPSKIDKSGLKCFPYTFTRDGLYTTSGIYLKGLTPASSYGADQYGSSVSVPSASCCG